MLKMRPKKWMRLQTETDTTLADFPAVKELYYSMEMLVLVTEIKFSSPVVFIH
jgi:hypothetical protein